MKEKMKTEAERTREKIKKLIGRKSGAEITGREKIELSSCRGIIGYQSELMIIRLCDGVVRICGTDLEIRNFFGGRIIITGKLNGIEYSDK